MIAVTGASGYVGAHCVAEAIKRGHRVLAISSQPAGASLTANGAQTNALRDQLIWQYIGDYHSLDQAEWSRRLKGVETVIHCAARVHQSSADADRHMHRDNVVVTETMARAAAQVGVKRIIFLSSAAVFGDEVNQPTFSSFAQLNGRSSYSVSKIGAEQKLHEIAISLGIYVDIYRPPVVYGADAPGNVSRLARMVAKGLPLPFGAINNRRSIVSIKGLVASIFWRVEDASAASAPVRIWQPTDRDAVSTTTMVNSIARGLQRPTKNLAVPTPLLRFALNACGQRRMAQQLLDSWEIDSSALRDEGFTAFADSEIELELLGRHLAKSV